eukprot:3181179-Pleurochrysis_carterae.AAC.2
MEEEDLLSKRSAVLHCSFAMADMDQYGQHGSRLAECRLVDICCQHIDAASGGAWVRIARTECEGVHRI